MSERGDTEPTPWHSPPETAVMERTSSGERGLKEAEIRHRLEQFGRNTLEAEKAATVWAMILKQLAHPLIYLLIGAAILSLATGHALDAAVIAVVVALNTALGAAQEFKADRAMEALHRMASPHARVLRDGREQDVLAEEVVPGDVLLLETGDRAAADARIVSSTDLYADESALTGESEPVAKRPGALPEEQPLADRTNMVWMSTSITAGRGRAVVVETRMRTALGRIAGEVRDTAREETPLQRRLARLGAALGVAGIALAAAVFVLGLLRGYEWVEMAMFSVAVAVSAIPEGLPAVISVTLALGVQRMARRRAIVRRLAAVETLGSTTVICSDKTGTITRNEMTATTLWTPAGAWEVSGGGFDPEGDIRPDGHPGQGGGLCEDVQLLLRVGAWANNAALVQEAGAWRVRGTPTEGAILVAACKAGFEKGELDKERPRSAEVPFSSEHKYMATLVGQASSLSSDEQKGATTGQAGSLSYGAAARIVCVKGAPDRVLGFCSHIMENGQAVELTPERREAVEQAIANFAGRALRVVAGAAKIAPANQEGLEREEAEAGLTFLGLWGLLDPPRPEAITAIADAQGAGIRVVMITGDHAATAAAVAQQVGIVGHGEEVVTGAELDAMYDEELYERAANVAVYARVTPAHKLRILQALKARGEVVAMTGDGVNDAPALKGADIGVAMGQAGTEVAREAADMVLTDDDFATIVHAVEEGRVIFSNLRRVVFFLITTNLGEVLTLAAALMLGLPLPLTAVMILWINLVTDGACTVPLGIEPMHWDVLKQKPRPPGAGVLDGTILRRMLILAPIMAAGTLGLFKWELAAGTPEHAQTVAFTTLAAFQWFHALNARSSRLSVFSVGLFQNLWLWGGIALAVVLQLLITHTPAGQTVFGIAPLVAKDWLLIVGVAGSIWVLDELLKLAGAYGKG